MHTFKSKDTTMYDIKGRKNSQYIPKVAYLVQNNFIGFWMNEIQTKYDKLTFYLFTKKLSINLHNKILFLVTYNINVVIIALPEPVIDDEQPVEPESVEASVENVI